MNNQHIPDPWIQERSQRGPHLTEHENIGFNGKLALFITHKFGSMGAFYFLAIWMIAWITLASLGVGFFKNDPYPFTFLLFLSNLVQLFSLPILAVGQQLLSKASDKQAKLTFKDTEILLKMQDEIHRLVKINNELTAEIHKNVVKKSEL